MEDILQAYVEALLRGDPPGARAVVRRAVDDGIPPDAVYVEVLQPALYRVGELWAAGAASVAQEHLATAVTALLLTDVGEALPRAANRGRTILIAATEGELHALGTRFLADLLEADGWLVLELGASTPAADLQALVRERRPDVVALSTSLPGNLAAARTSLALLSELPERPVLAVGGRAYANGAAVASHVGADLYAPDARAFVAVAAERFPR